MDALNLEFIDTTDKNIVDSVIELADSINRFAKENKFLLERKSSR
jgi:hypothetical protein